MEQLQHLNRLSEVNSNKGVRFLHKAATPGCHCPMHTALATLLSVGGVSSLVVGMPECGYYSRFVMDSPYGRQGELHYVYELDANEVVFGCREGLMKALLRMEQEGAKMILLIITCIPALIGEDAQAVIEELSETMQAKLFFMDVAHFKRNGYQSGYSLFFEKLADILEYEAGKAESKLLNLLGSSEGSDMKDFKELAVLQGIRVNPCDERCSMEQLKQTVYGTVSIVLSVKMLGLAKRLYGRFGIPYVCFYHRFLAEDIAEGYSQVLKLLGIINQEVTAEAHMIQRELNEITEQPDNQNKTGGFPEENSSCPENLRDYHSKLMLLQGQSKSTLTGIRYMAASPELDVLPVSAYLCELGMEPVLLHVEEYYEDYDLWKEKLLSRGIDPYITYVADRSRLAEAVGEQQIQLSFGTFQGFSQDRCLTEREISILNSLCGYERSMKLVQLILQRIIAA